MYRSRVLLSTIIRINVGQTYGEAVVSAKSLSENSSHIAV